jgi:hypothetical protein
MLSTSLAYACHYRLSPRRTKSILGLPCPFGGVEATRRSLAAASLEALRAAGSLSSSESPEDLLARCQLGQVEEASAILDRLSVTHSSDLSRKALELRANIAWAEGRLEDATSLATRSVAKKIEHGSRFVATQRHGRLLGNAGAHEVAHACASKVVRAARVRRRTDLTQGRCCPPNPAT